MAVLISRGWNLPQTLARAHLKANQATQRRFIPSFFTSNRTIFSENHRRYFGVLPVNYSGLFFKTTATLGKSWNINASRHKRRSFSNLKWREEDTLCGYDDSFPQTTGPEDHLHISATAREASNLREFAEDRLPHFSDSFSSIIKLYCDSTDPNYSQPWQMRKQIKSTGSGFIIKDRLILTNAHCVSWHNRCLVRKHGSTDKYVAKVVQIGHECDLAVLTVENDSFWEGVQPLDFGEVPFLHDNVTVVGYPTGGDNLCITSGVVSRVDVTTYCHSNFRLLCVQIDAAINAGNSGGPALRNGKVVGVAFQAYDEAQNVGYVIPTPVIRQFLRQIHSPNPYSGFVTLGITYQLLTNPSLKSYLIDKSLNTDVNGILVCQRDVNLAGKIEPNDVIMEINGHKIADDGTVHFRGVERVHLAYSLTDKICGDDCTVKLFRNNQIHEIKVLLGKPCYLVPEHQWDVMPRYFIYGGLVFIPLTMEYLKDEFGKKFYERAPSQLLKPLSDSFSSEQGEEVIVLSQILASDLTVGYDFKNVILRSINHTKPLNLKHLEEIIDEETKKDFIRFEFDQGVVVLLETSKVPEVEQKTLNQHAITRSKSTLL